ncbi:MAG: ribonuclease H-like domain-containing protein, partial [Planctomycetota bacterium]
MFNKEVLARLGQVNRRRTPMSERKKLGPPHELPITKEHPTPNPDEDLSQLSAGEEVTNRWGTHWIRRRPLSELWPRADDWLRQALQRLGPCREVPPIKSDELGTLRTSFPERVVYLDLETCGFAGSMVFMVGLIHWYNNRFQLDQLMARNYAEEKAMLQTLWSIVAEQQVLVTFNGKSFDWPMVHDRSTVHHLGREAKFGPENGSVAPS